MEGGSGAPVPALLTVEEAAALLRIGRTKAYAMTREWRATGGLSGLPVVDFGNVLRVPLAALEEMTGAHLGSTTAPPAPSIEPQPATTVDDKPLAFAGDEPPPPTSDASPAPPRRQRRSSRSAEQLNLFNSPAA